MLSQMKVVLGIFVENVMSPAVARTGELDEVVKTLKQVLARYVVDRHAAPKEVLARHLGKSHRWLYRQLEDMEQEPTRPPRGDGGHKSHEGHRLMCDSLRYFHEISPSSGSATACAMYLRDHGWKISTFELEPLLELYSGMGYLDRLPREKPTDEVAFRAREAVYTVKASGREERMQLLERHSGALIPIAVSYLRGDEAARFSMSEGEVLEEHLISAVRDIWRYQVRRLNEAVEASIRDDPDEVGPKIRYRAMFLCGLGPFFDDPGGG